MSIVCPVCNRPIEIPDDAEEYIRSIRQIGCDECVWKAVRERAKGS